MIRNRSVILLIIFSSMVAGCSGGIDSGSALGREDPRWLMDREILRLLEENRFSSALSVTDSLLRAGESDPRLLGQRAYALGMTGRADEAVPLFEKAILADYENWWNHFAFARVLAERGITGRAIAEYNEALRFCEGGDCAEVNRNLAVTYLRAGKNAQARELIEDGLRRDPRNGYLLGLRALLEARSNPARADTCDLSQQAELTDFYGLNIMI
jgi:tetratricopeptide (TPR) repeat protein